MLHVEAGPWREMVRRILSAYSLRNKKVGYVQSTGYLAAALLYITQLETEADEGEGGGSTATREANAEERKKMREARDAIEVREKDYREKSLEILHDFEKEMDGMEEGSDEHQQTLAKFVVKKRQYEDDCDASKRRIQEEFEALEEEELEQASFVSKPDGAKMDEMHAFWCFASFIEVLCPGVWDNRSVTQDKDEVLTPMPGFFVLQDIIHRCVTREIPGLLESLVDIGFMPSEHPHYPGMLETTVFTEWCHPVFSKTLSVPQLAPLYHAMYERHESAPSVCMVAYTLAVVKNAENDIRAMREPNPMELREILFGAADAMQEGELAAGLAMIVPSIDCGWERDTKGLGGSFKELYSKLYTAYTETVQNEKLGDIASAVIKDLKLSGGMLSQEELKAALSKASNLAVDLEVGLTLTEFQGVIKAVLPAFRADLLGNEGRSGAEMLFSIFDYNGDGKVSMRELYSGLGLLAAGSVEKKLEMCFKLYDVDKDGELSAAEVADLFQMISRFVYGVDNPTAAKREAATLFQLVDTNADGHISLEEFKQWSGVRPAILAFFQELGLSQVQAEELPNAMAMLRPTPEKITSQLQRWVPPYLLDSCKQILQELETAETPEEAQEAKARLAHEIGSSILQQAMSAATDQAKEERLEASSSMNLSSMGPYSSLNDESIGLIAGESVLLPSTPCVVRSDNGDQPKRIIVTNYRLMILPTEEDSRRISACTSGQASVFLPLGAVSKMQFRSPNVAGVLSIRPKYCFEYVHIEFGGREDTELMRKVLDSKILGSASLIQNTFAFSHGAFATSATRGWNLYQPATEFGRMDIPDGSLWRISDVNEDYHLSPSLPRVIVVPSKLSDDAIRAAGAMNGFDTKSDPEIDLQTRGRVANLVWRRDRGDGLGHVSIMRSGPLQFRGFWVTFPAQSTDMLSACFKAAAGERGERLVVDAGGGDSSEGTAPLYAELGLEYIKAPVPQHKATRAALYKLQKEHRSGEDFESSKWASALWKLLESADLVADLNLLHLTPS